MSTGLGGNGSRTLLGILRERALSGVVGLVFGGLAAGASSFFHAYQKIAVLEERVGALQHSTAHRLDQLDHKLDVLLLREPLRP